MCLHPAWIRLSVTVTMAFQKCQLGLHVPVDLLAEEGPEAEEVGREIDVLALGLGLVSDQLLEGGVVVVVVVAEEWQEELHWTVPTADIVVGKTPFPPDRTLFHLLEFLVQHFGETFYQMCAPLMCLNSSSISK